MRRMRHAAVVAALLCALTACGGEVVHTTGIGRGIPSAPAVPSGLAPSDMAAPDECVTPIDVFDTGELLRPTQIMTAPAGQGADQQSWMYVISPSNCGSDGYRQPECDKSFPWAGPGNDDIGGALGPIGVTSVVTSTTRYDTPAASVTETIVTLSGAAGSILDTFAGDCGYVQVQGDIYAAKLGTDAFAMLQIRNDVAVGVEFDATGLDESQRRSVLVTAVAQVPSA